MKSIDDCIVGFENIKPIEQISFQNLNFFFYSKLDMINFLSKKKFFKCYNITLYVKHVLIKQNSKSWKTSTTLDRIY